MIEDKISISNVSQEIDLVDAFGREPTREEAQEFAEMARDLVIDRTQNSTKRGGGKFEKYSPEYAAFKGSTEVDLTLFGDMLNAIDSRVAGNKAVLFIDPSDDLNTKKAFNHQTGDTVPARPFFGLTTEEAREIADQTRRVVEESDLVDTLGTAAIFQQFQGNVNDGDIGSILSTIGLL